MLVNDFLLEPVSADEVVRYKALVSLIKALLRRYSGAIEALLSRRSCALEGYIEPWALFRLNRALMAP